MTWGDYMKNYGYREYPCQDHGLPFCEKCYGPDPLRAGSTVCVHMNEPFDCPQCREDRSKGTNGIGPFKRGTVPDMLGGPG